MPAADFAFSGTSKLIFVTSGVTSVDVQDLYSRWKDWATTSDNSKYLQALRTFGGDPTISGQFAPRYYFLTNGWRVSIDNQDRVIVGTNLYTEELVTPYNLTSGSTVEALLSDAVVVDKGIAQSLDYNGIVHINTNIGIVGTAWPVGTIAQPVSNLTEAKIIAASYNISKYNIYGSVPFNVDLNNSVVHGGNLTDIIDLQGINLSGTTFRECILGGSFEGNVFADNCQLSDGLSGMSGTFQRCGVGGSLYFTEGTTSTLLDSSSQIPGNESPALFLKPNVLLNMRKYSGGLSFYDVQSGTTITTEYLAGNCRILSGCTGGILNVRGIALLTDSSSGTTVDTTGLLVPYTVAQQHSLNTNTEISKNQ